MYSVKSQQLTQFCIEMRWFKGEGGKRGLQNKPGSHMVTSIPSRPAWLVGWLREARRGAHVSGVPKARLPLSSSPLCCLVAFSPPPRDSLERRRMPWFPLAGAGSRENRTKCETASCRSSCRTGGGPWMKAPWSPRRCWADRVWPACDQPRYIRTPSSAPMTCCPVQEEVFTWYYSLPNFCYTPGPVCSYLFV